MVRQGVAYLERKNYNGNIVCQKMTLWERDYEIEIMQHKNTKNWA